MPTGILVIREGFRRGLSYRVGERSLTLGRSDENEVQLIDDSISRRHALVCWEGFGYRIADLQSKNGVFVNNVRIREVMLREGDLIRLGTTTIEMLKDPGPVYDGTQDQKITDRLIVEPPTNTFELNVAEFLANAGPEAEPSQAPAPEPEPKAAPAPAPAVIAPDEALPAPSPTMQCIHDLNLAAARGASPQQLLELTSKAVRDVLQADRFVLFRLESDGRASRRIVVVKEDLTEAVKAVKPHKKAVALALKRRRPVHLTDLPDGGIRSLSVVPIAQSDKRTVGALYADSVREGGANISDDDHDVLLMIAFVLRNAIK